MPNKTENFNLTLPTEQDIYNVEDFNDNFTTLENEIVSREQSMNAKVEDNDENINNRLTEAKESLQTLIEKNQSVLKEIDHSMYCLMQSQYAPTTTLRQQLTRGQGANFNTAASQEGFRQQPTQSNDTNQLYMEMTNHMEEIPLGATYNYDIVTDVSFSIPLVQTLPTGSKIKLKFFARGEAYVTSGNMTIGGVGTVQFGLSAQYQEIVIERTLTSAVSSIDLHFYTSGYNVYLKGDSSAPAATALCGSLSVPTGKRLQDSLPANAQSLAVSFDEARLYMKCSCGSGENIVPQITKNSGATWQDFTLTDSFALADGTEERIYTVQNLVQGTGYQMRFNFSRTSYNTTPKLYRYCLAGNYA